MRKWVLFTFVVFLLSGCVKISTVNVSKLDELPRKVDKYIQPELRLQLINKNQNHCYIIYRTENDVQFLIGNDGNAVRLSLFEEPSNSSEVKTYI
ncbi:hypothetical protein [Solibacillus sp. CAU 1738]|uniref:hypothetical protein n=1 Tax=Solibacillus sp. CAU 1738 TaxID=3140363 RepID=UPI003261AD5F